MWYQDPDRKKNLKHSVSSKKKYGGFKNKRYYKYILSLKNGSFVKYRKQAISIEARKRFNAFVKEKYKSNWIYYNIFLTEDGGNNYSFIGTVNNKSK